MSSTSSKIWFVVVAIVIAVAAVFPFLNGSETDSANATESAKKTQSAKKESVKYTNEHLPEFAKIRDVKEKKAKFFGYLKPLVEAVNQDIRNDRAFVKSLAEFPDDQEERINLSNIIKRYDIDIEEVDIESEFDLLKSKLLRRVDTLPVALVLMQAANESAWGTSRFALQANNLFGQWCFSPGCGVVPKGRPDGETYEVRKFNHPIESIRSYFNNLNTGHAYVKLRDIRQQKRAEGESLDATELAEGLTQYSIRREEYVVEIQNMIRVNKKYL